MDTEAIEEAIDFTLQTTETVELAEEKVEQAEVPETPQEIVEPEVAENPAQIFVTENGFLTLHKDHPEFMNLIRLQLENQELINWKEQLKARINTERTECVRLKRLIPDDPMPEVTSTLATNDPEIEKLVEHLMKENSLLEQKRILLAKEIVEENISLIQMQVDVAMKQFVL